MGNSRTTNEQDQSNSQEKGGELNSINTVVHEHEGTIEALYMHKRVPTIHMPPIIMNSFQPTISGEYAVCHKCNKTIYFGDECFKIFWMNAAVGNKSFHTLDIEIRHLETNFVNCRDCGEALIKDKVMETSKLKLLLSKFSSTTYFVPPVFEPFVETCKTCHREIGTLEGFVVIGANRCNMEFDPDLNRDSCNILQRVPIFVYCQNCGYSVYGENLREVLQW